MATVVRKGDRESGALFIKVNGFNQGCVVYSGISTPSGEEGWQMATGPEPVAEKDADAYLARQTKYDADLWIVEVEDPKGVFRMDAAVVRS
jgi:GMP synthase (glutamine-hydrolysing)